MDHSLDYANLLKKTLKEATVSQPRLQSIRLYPVCDLESGHFLILATGWDNQKWLDHVLFHARLVNNQVIIEDDNFEDGLTAALVDAGIHQEDIKTSLEAEV
ncbi:MAG: element excision factor XisI family protein [Cyanobacteria bacterium P01_F01_bin.150]